MSDFTPIETQEQLNAIIGERISRAEQKAAEKYSDYDDVKKQNDAYAKQLADLQEQLKKQDETMKGRQAEVDALTAKVQNFESSSLKTRIALETGLPYKMAERLTGTTEEEVRADAEMMVKLMGAQTPAAPIGTNDPVITTDSKDAALKKLAAQLGG